MMVLTMVLTRKWWFHGDWQFNHEQNAGFMGISWGKWSIWWSWPCRKDGDITILAMQGWWLVISWGFKQRWYRGKLMEYLTEYYQPYGVFFIVVSWWFHRESTHFMARYCICFLFMTLAYSMFFFLITILFLCEQTVSTLRPWSWIPLLLSCKAGWLFINIMYYIIHTYDSWLVNLWFKTFLLPLITPKNKNIIHVWLKKEGYY